MGRVEEMREGQRRTKQQTLDPIISPQPLIKTTSRKLVKSRLVACCGGLFFLQEVAGPGHSALPVVAVFVVAVFSAYSYF